MPDLPSLIISILPYAIGALFSPLILATLLAMVSPTDSPRFSSFSYLFGSIIFFLILVFVGLYIGSGLSAAIPMPVQIGGIIEVALGTILVIVALKTLFIREEARKGGFIGFINSLREDKKLSIFVKFFYMGFISILASFTTSILITLAGIIIGLSNPGFTDSMITVIILGLISLFVVEVSFILYIISPDIAEDLLEPFRGGAPKYGDYITTIVYLFLGFFFVIRGFMAI